jgi:AlkA-like protein
VRCTPCAASGTSFDGASLLRFLAARRIAGIEELDGNAYRRSMTVDGHAVVAALALESNALRAAVRSAEARSPGCAGIIARITGSRGSDASIATVSASKSNRFRQRCATASSNGARDDSGIERRWSPRASYATMHLWASL